MAIKSIMDLNKDLRTTLNNVPALIDTLERGFAGVNNEISSGAEPNKAINSFNTINGGLLSECKVALSPIQSLHGYDHPWAGGASKQLIPMTVDGIKALNTGGTWNGNVYTRNGGTFTILTDADNNVIGIKINGTFTANTDFIVMSSNLQHSGTTTYKINGASQNAHIILWNDSWTGIGGAGYGQDVEKTMTDGTYIRQCAIQASAGTIDNETAYPMIRLATETDPTFEPYSNICPISGHAQVDVDVSDEQTTQEQVTVALGNTYYSGVLDVVSGVLTIDSAYIGSYDGESLPSTWISDRDAYTPGTTPTSGAEVVYKLATPTTVELSPTTVKALAGVNYITAPSNGQEIVEVEYKEIFTFEDVEEAIENAVASVYPATPATDGTYVLTLVKDGTSITRSWVSTES